MFTGNRDDQVDLAYFDGIVRDSRFEENGRDVRATMKKPFFGGGWLVFAGVSPRQADLSVDIDERSTQIRIPAGVVERFDLTGLQPERVVEAFSALSAASEAR